MKITTPPTSENSTNSHNNPAAKRRWSEAPAELSSGESKPSSPPHAPPIPERAPATAAPSTSLPPPPAPAENPVTSLIPPALRERRFRALSFAAQLTIEQRALVCTWLGNPEYSIEQVRQKIAAPAPEGLGLPAQPTILRPPAQAPRK